MIVENYDTNGRSDKHEVLAYAQTISNFFIDALDQNDCNVKVVVGFYQELDDTIDSILDLNEAFKKPIAVADKKKPYKRPLEYDDIIEKPLETDFITAAAVESLKNKCFNCNLQMPKINFSNDLAFLTNKLTSQLEAYKATFQNPFKGNFCHLVYAMQYNCIPDIVKLIGMIMTAYAAVLALNKLPTFSLNAFIKGIVGTLLAKVVGSINISLDASSTGLPCLLGVLEELAFKAPTYENLSVRLTDVEKQNSWVLDYESVESLKERLDKEMIDGAITSEEYDNIVDEHRKKYDPINHYSEALEEQVGKAEEAVSEIFDYVNTILDSAQGDINSYIGAVLGVINFFECENKRSGPDFTEVMAYLQNMTTVINIFSALIAILVKKTLRLDLCKDEQSYRELIDTLEESPKIPLTKTDLEDIITEFTQNKAEISEDGLAVLIYDKPVLSKLPKLELMGCNFKEFAEAHSLENIVKSAVEDYLNEEENKKNDYYNDYAQSAPLDKGKDFNFEYDSTSNKTYRDSIDKVVFDKFTPGRGNNGSSSVEENYNSLKNPNTGIGSSIIKRPSLKDHDKFKDLIYKNFKEHGFTAEDYYLGSPVFNKNYIHAKDLYNYVNSQKVNPLNQSFLDSYYEGNFGYSPSNTEYTQNIRDFTYGKNYIDVTTQTVPNLNSGTKEDNVEYQVIDKVAISMEELLGEGSEFTGVLDDILDFIYNDPKPSKSNNETTTSDKDVDTGSIHPETNFDEEFSIYTKRSLNIKESTDNDKSTDSRSIPSGAECRSVEDVMNVLKNIKI